MILVSDIRHPAPPLQTSVSSAAARQGAGGGEPCLSVGYSSSLPQMTSVRKTPPGAQTVRVALDTPLHFTAWLPLPLTSETCIRLKYVSALIGKTITLPLPVFDFLVSLFRKHRHNLRSLHIDISRGGDVSRHLCKCDSMNGMHCQQHLRLDPSPSGHEIFIHNACHEYCTTRPLLDPGTQ